jgi:ATP-binding cassette subfamily B protein
MTAVCTLVQVFLNAPGVIVGVMLGYLVLTITISAFQIRSQNGIREKIVGQKNELDGQICQSINNIELIRSMNAEQYEKKRLIPRILNISGTEKKHHRYMGAFDCLKQLCKIAFQVILLVMSIVMTANGKMSAGSVITVCLLFQQLVKPIDEVYRFMDETASSLIKAKALLEVSASPSDEVYAIGSFGETSSSHDIHINDVVVTNPEKNKPLAWYGNIVIHGGKIIALKGPNGSGKTSLIHCLTRFFPHIQGRINIFGRDQETISQEELTSMLYYTPQKTFFIAGTIRENLLYGLKEAVEDDELINALLKVHLAGYDHSDTVIKKNPAEALDFIISERGNELSGGMGQRLSLARAFLRRPKLFVFDEITANLDSAAVGYVLSSIEEYAKQNGAGILYISHDPAVVNRCDEIIELENKLRQQHENKKAA